jgi:hypothetical protein
MELDNLALESVMDARRKAVQTSIRQISTEELNSLVTEILFEDPAHPWCEIFRQFIKDNRKCCVLPSIRPRNTYSSFIVERGS